MADPRAEQESLSRGDSVARTALAASSDVPSTSGVSSRLFGRVDTGVITGLECWIGLTQTAIKCLVQYRTQAKHVYSPSYFA